MIPFHIGVYYGLHFLSFVVAIAYVVVFAPKYELKRSRAIAFATFTFVTVYAVMLLLYWICTGQFGGQNLVRVFVFLPLIVLFYGKVFELKVSRAMDLAAPAMCIVMSIGKIACQHAGCCESWWIVDWGIYNESAKANLFPVQTAEGITTLLIAIVLIWLSARHHYNYGGLCMPWMLLLFGATRFMWEFMRDNQKILWKISELALWAAASALVGALWLGLHYAREKKQRK